MSTLDNDASAVNDLLLKIARSALSLNPDSDDKWEAVRKREETEARQQRPAKSLIENPHYVCSV